MTGLFRARLILGSVGSNTTTSRKWSSAVDSNLTYRPTGSRSCLVLVPVTFLFSAKSASMERVLPKFSLNTCSSATTMESPLCCVSLTNLPVTRRSGTISAD